MLDNSLLRRAKDLPRLRPVTQVFSTEPLPKDIRFDAFRARINSMFEMKAFDRSEERDFFGRIRSVHLGALIVSTMETTSFAFARSRRRILTDFIDHVLLRIDLDGPFETGGRPIGVLVIDLGRIIDVGVTPASNISVVVPRRVLGLPDEALATLHGVRLETPMALILADHIVSVVRHVGDVDLSDAEAIGALTPALIAACLKPGEDRVGRARADLDVVTVGRARAFIEANLRDPRLNPESVARGVGVSRAGLYRLLEPAGGVAKAIREARLKQALHDIVERGATARLGDIGHALCFSSEAQFSRAFKAQFGFTPREARAAVVEGRNVSALGDGAPDPDRLVFGEWLSRL
ncbi:helix-turn-helix domain-containing protein [Methylobrevis pamukkalensis]|uniref:Transcriptional activator FeaR n=1 Tax=Methylobrevis pamukkalensis TaxID=1439726 RepID=A0A1E3H1N4_9HYPH|nr:helix-turn-helix domain-containing protein [Methylobrevis pamukkalensis]ODN70239.1 Transcriptional activator FeaR [Methylobrevis pamukkalensis]